jgi:hypothetical protein
MGKWRKWRERRQWRMRIRGRPRKRRFLQRSMRQASLSGMP